MFLLPTENYLVVTVYTFSVINILLCTAWQGNILASEMRFHEIMSKTRRNIFEMS